MVKLSISIVNYNSGDYLTRCLESIEKVRGEADLKVYILDNASTDDSFEKAKKKFKDTLFIKSDENLGFSKGQNIILRKIETEYILILNPDCEILEGTIKYMLKFMEENEDIGATSCLVEKEDGSIDWASHRGFPTPMASFKYYFLKDDSLYHLRDKNMTKTHEVDAIVGAFFLTRKSVLEKVGLFDEKFFMYGEDIDLCFRIKEKGFKVMYVPEVKILHHKGVSSGLKKHTQHVTTATSQSRLKAFNAFYEAMKIFYKKHYEKKYPKIINWLIYSAIDLKWFLAKRKMVV